MPFLGGVFLEVGTCALTCLVNFLNVGVGSCGQNRQSPQTLLARHVNILKLNAYLASADALIRICSLLPGLGQLVAGFWAQCCRVLGTVLPGFGHNVAGVWAQCCRVLGTMLPGFFFSRFCILYVVRCSICCSNFWFLTLTFSGFLWCIGILYPPRGTVLVLLQKFLVFDSYFFWFIVVHGDIVSSTWCGARIAAEISGF